MCALCGCVSVVIIIFLLLLLFIECLDVTKPRIFFMETDKHVRCELFFRSSIYGLYSLNSDRNCYSV